MAESGKVETFVIDGCPHSSAWIDFGYRSGPKVVLAESLGALRYVPGQAYDELLAQRDQLDQQVRELEGRLAECYRLTGSDPDGDPDSMLAQHAVHAVRELREEADKAGEWEERAFAAARQVRELLSEIDAHRSLWKGGTPVRNEGLRKVWDDDQELYAAADRVRKERGE